MNQNQGNSTEILQQYIPAKLDAFNFLIDLLNNDLISKLD